LPNSRSSHNVIKPGRPDSHSVVYSSYDRFPGSEDSGCGEFWDRGPQWSPDESKVLFERHGRNNEGERIVDLWTVDVAWSPDGKTLPISPSIGISRRSIIIRCIFCHS